MSQWSGIVVVVVVVLVVVVVVVHSFIKLNFLMSGCVGSERAVVWLACFHFYGPSLTLVEYLLLKYFL